jgi:putative DNA primase/helicase
MPRQHSSIDFRTLIAPVAAALWGQPTIRSPYEWRWGTRGSRKIDLRRGTWANFETGKGGGVLDLIEREKGCNRRDAMRWLAQKGFDREMNPASGANSMRAEMMDEYDKMRQAITILRAAAGAFGKPVREWPDRNACARPTAYLQGRGINFVPDNCMLLSQTDAVKLQDHIPKFKAFPAMVMPIIGPNGLQGASVTYLTRDATQNMRIKDKNVRRIYGKKSGGYVAVGDIHGDHPMKLAAEGIEDAASLQILTKCPAIAVLGKGNFTAANTLQCSELIIGGDNDSDGKGRETAEEMAQVLVNGNRRVRIAIPKNHKDWNDALRDPNVDHAQLRDAIRNADLVEEAAEVGAISVVDFMDFSFPPRVYLLEPWLTNDSIAMIHAYRGNGKTWLALAIAFALASCEPLLGWKVHKKVRVLYVDGELSGEELQSRLKLFGRQPENLSILSRHWLHVHEQELPDLGQEEGRTYLDRQIERSQADVIILDSISTLVRSGIENDAESWAPIGDWQLMHRWAGRSIIYLHDEGRSGNPRGTSKREDPFNTEIRLREDVAIQPTRRRRSNSATPSTGVSTVRIDNRC